MSKSIKSEEDSDYNDYYCKAISRLNNKRCPNCNIPLKRITKWVIITDRYECPKCGHTLVGVW